MVLADSVDRVLAGSEVGAVDFRENVMEKARPGETPEQRQEREFQERAKRLSGDKLLNHHLNGIRLAIAEHSANTGKWASVLNTTLQQGLAAIALAASTPEDNSAAVKEFTDRIKKQVDALKSAGQQQPE